MLPFRRPEAENHTSGNWQNLIATRMKDREPDPDFEGFLINLGVELWLAKQDKRTVAKAA